MPRVGDATLGIVSSLAAERNVTLLSSSAARDTSTEPRSTCGDTRRGRHETTRRAARRERAAASDRRERGAARRWGGPLLRRRPRAREVKRARSERSVARRERDDTTARHLARAVPARSPVRPTDLSKRELRVHHRSVVHKVGQRDRLAAREHLLEEPGPVPVGAHVGPRRSGQTTAARRQGARRTGSRGGSSSARGGAWVRRGHERSCVCDSPARPRASGTRAARDPRAARAKRAIG